MTADALAFFLDRYRAELPARIHSRDIDAGGAPAWARAFEAYINDGSGRWAVSIREDQDHCSHPTGQKPCPTCDDTGLRVRVRSTYRHPIKRALAELARVPVPKGRPRLDATLIVLAENDGNLGLAIAALAPAYSYMWDARRARRWVLHALCRLRAAYREDAPAWELRKSEAQLDAEAA